MPSSQHPTTSAGQKSRSGRRSAWQAPRAWHNQRRSGPTCGSCNLSLQGGRTQQLSFLRSQPRKDRGESAISGSHLAGGPDTRRARARISGDLRVARAETSSASKPCSIDAPARGLISPEEFVPIAEECGLIVRTSEKRGGVPARSCRDAPPTTPRTR